MTRRVLLGAGAATGLTALAGCGPPEPAARPAEFVLGGQLAAERILQGVLEAAPGTVASRLAARSRGRVTRLEAAGADDAAVDLAAPSGPDAAYAALLIHQVAALPELPRRLRVLVAELIREAAADQATLRARAGREPVALPFPGRPSRP